uniref:Uncharacterized protein n=1 Tax=Magallana gigas TaxID=29159 RepID=A0A8W8MLI0_MAGGI
MRRGTILKQLPDTDKDVLIKKWKDKINLFLSPEVISVGDALELQDGSRVTVRGTVKEVSDVFMSKTSTNRVVRLDQGGCVAIKLWETKSSLSPAVGSTLASNGLSDVDVKGIEESILIPPALLQEFFPTSVFSTRLPLTGIKVGNTIVRIQRQTTLGKTRQKRE